MKEMKRVLTALIAASYILSAAGCGNNSADKSTNAQSGVEQAVTSADVTQSRDDEDTSDITAGLVYDESDNTWTTTDESMQKFVKIMKSECAKSPDIKGTYLLASDNEVLFIGGINSTEKDGSKTDAYTVYEIGSVTKTFTATAVLQLCEQGKISLDDTLSKYFPDYEKGKDINLYQLLHMQSGIQREFFSQEKLMTEGIELFKKYYNDGFTMDELLSELYSYDLEYEPGTQYSYSNVNYVLLALIIEQVSGESYDEYIQKNIFDVCGMEHSSSMKTGDVSVIPDPPPEGLYDFDIYEVFPDGYWSQQRSSRGAGDIHCCATDMLAFDRALIGGKLISEGSLAEMFKIDKNYGCGWTEMPGKNNVFFHDGATAFFKANNMYVNSEKYGNIYLIQLHPTMTGDEFSTSCMNSIALAANT